MPCDAPLITYILLKLGIQHDSVQQSVARLIDGWQNEKGWFCDFFFVRGIYKKLQIGCPMAGLQALEVFSEVPGLRDSKLVSHAFAPIRYHRDSGKSLYFFGRSKKFFAFKYPFVWYNALYMADVLSRFPQLHAEPLFQELIEWICEAQDENGRWKPTSMFMPYKGWEFANKKEASPWISFLCYRILKRVYC